MPTKKISITDSVVYGEGVTVKDGVSADRNISIGDNSATDRILFENGSYLLLEDNSSKFLRDIVVTLEDD